MNWTLLQNSLLVAAGSTAAALVCGVMAALAVSGLPVRWRRLCVVGAIAALAMPPFLVTSGWLDMLGATGWLRRWLPLNIYTLPGTIWILALLTWPVSMLLTLGAWQKLDAAHLQCEPGLRGLPLLRFLLLPAARPALALAAVIVAVLTLNNFAVPAILQTRVFPAELWISFSTTFDYRRALLLSWPLVIGPLLLLL